MQRSFSVLFRWVSPLREARRRRCTRGEEVGRGVRGGSRQDHVEGRFFQRLQFSGSHCDACASLRDDTSVLQSAAGVQQGDPLGPLLFSLCSTPWLERLKRSFPTLTFVSGTWTMGLSLVKWTMSTKG